MLGLVVGSLGVLSLSVRSLGLLSLRVRRVGIVRPQVLRVSCYEGSLSLHYSCASGLLSAGASGVVLLELELLEVREPLVCEVLVLEVLELEVLLELELLEVLEPLVSEVLVLEVLELLQLGVLLELELLELLELGMLLELELLEQGVLLEQEVLEIQELVEILELLETLELEVLALGVLVLLELVLEALCDRDRTFHSVPRQCPLPVPGTHQMALRPSSVSLPVPLPSPPASSLADELDPESGSLCAASPTLTHVLATVVIDHFFDSTTAFALVAELVDFATAYRLDYAATLVAESESVCPPSVRVAAQRDYELHSLDFSTAFLQGSLHEEIWLRCPPGFTVSFLAGTQWSLRRPIYGLRHAPCEWHDTLKMSLVALGLAPSTADPSLFLRTDTSLPPFYILVYVDDLVFATADSAGIAHVKSELQ
ncbi:unnamed protein product [Closterium sp. NIES-65]|nr:unnamed protein product [Closterium sp. NIES-65]